MAVSLSRTQAATPLAEASESPLIVIEPTSGWQVINVRELVEYWDLLWLLSKRSISARYRQSVLGFGWAFIKPFVTMVVFSVIFGRLAGVPTDGVPQPVFYLAGLIPWTFFASSIGSATNSLTANKDLFTKVYFPRLILPFSSILTNAADFAISFILLALVMGVYGVMPTWGILALPVLILVLVATAAGMGMWLATLALQFRDVGQAMSFMTQFLMYSAPVVWPVSLIAERFPVWGDTLRLVYGFYPMAGVVEGFRSALTGNVPMPWDLIGCGAISALLLLVSGALYFRRTERQIADIA